MHPWPWGKLLEGGPEELLSVLETQCFCAPGCSVSRIKYGALWHEPFLSSYSTEGSWDEFFPRRCRRCSMNKTHTWLWQSWACSIRWQAYTFTFQIKTLGPALRPSGGCYPPRHLLWDAERLEKADFVRPASHSRLSCMLAKALRSLTSRRISCGGMSLSPRFPIRTSDSLPKAALKNKQTTAHLLLGKGWGRV